MFIVKGTSVLLIIFSVISLVSPAYAEKSSRLPGEEAGMQKQQFIDADGDGLNDLIIDSNGDGIPDGRMRDGSGRGYGNAQGNRTRQQGVDGAVINNSGQRGGGAGSAGGLRMNGGRR